PFYREIEIAVQCLASLADYTAGKRRLSGSERASVAKPAPAAARIIAGAREQARTGLLETEAREMLACYAIGVPPTLLARSEEDAEAVIAALGDGPLALKVVSRDILHKSDAGGVRLNV